VKEKGERERERERVKERKSNKKRDTCVNSATLHMELYYSDMHHKCILHLICIIKWMDFLVN